MVTRRDVEQEVRRLRRVVSEAVAATDTANLDQISAVLHQAAASVQSLHAQATSRGDTVVVPTERMQVYFPARSGAPTADDLHLADEHWRLALERGRRYRTEARAQVGPLMTPAETARRLGVSPVTVNKWRRQDKLLGLRFDDHQYVYPVFQFADSPLQGERGVLRHLDDMLGALGERTAWEKALFFLAEHPRLGGITPLEILRQGPTPAMLDRLYELAQYAGEMGS